MTLHLWNYSRFLRAPFQFSKRAAGEATEFSRSRVELLSVIGAASLECGKPAAEAGELIRRELGNSFGDFFDFHVALFVRWGEGPCGSVCVLPAWVQGHRHY